ncbi:hypothetical protein ACFCWD_03655, partial [Streptomyces sp. NPDC056374]|uniref:hypothetical protein n=1 Tax=Streptomyces sp. NPDC056374 TaxID=3345799 RepID=UPI0035DFB4AA
VAQVATLSALAADGACLAGTIVEEDPIGSPGRRPRPSPALRTWRRVVRRWNGSDYLTTPSDA